MIIPTVVALSEFFRANFPNISWYPNWYLGNPYQYLIGPIIPALLTILNTKYLILNTYLALIFLSFIIGALGIYFLLLDWGVDKKQALISSLLYLLIPFGIFLLNYQNGLFHIVFGFFPFILILYRRLLLSKFNSMRTTLMLVLLITFVLLIDISILLPIVIGFAAMFFTLKNRGDWDYLGTKSVLILFLGISLATVWYTPKFWWVLLSNPSIGGIGLSNLIVSLFKMLLNLLPVALAVVVTRWRKYEIKPYLLFSIIFFASFFFLSLVRFLSDPNFVMDWTGFLLELQFGGAIIIGSLIGKFKVTTQKSKVFYAILFGIAIWLNGYIVSHSAIQPFSHEPSGYQSRIISMVKDNVKSNERIFLSGSSVFFINQYLDALQVRGGVDQGSVHPYWAHGAYQIREGSDPELVHDWLKALGASYILVHQKNSKDVFHDFKNTERFSDQDYFTQVSEQSGDGLYNVEGAAVARKADKNLLFLQSPKNGADKQALYSYVQTLKTPLEYTFKNGKIWLSGNIGQDEVISLAITYDSHFKITEGQGRLVKDSIGNMVIIPKKEGQQYFILTYQTEGLESIIPLIFGLSSLILLINYHKVYPHFKKRLPSLHVGAEDDDY